MIQFAISYESFGSREYLVLEKPIRQ